ncbi:hypothetical protein GEMRC1_008035 [Eukaryota sp. GEM-RC1]
MILTQTERFPLASSLESITPKSINSDGLILAVARCVVTSPFSSHSFVTKEKYKHYFLGLSVVPIFQEFLEAICLESVRSNAKVYFIASFVYYYLVQLITNYTPSHQFLHVFEKKLVSSIDKALLTLSVSDLFSTIRHFPKLCLCYHLFYSTLLSVQPLFKLVNDDVSLKRPDVSEFKVSYSNHSVIDRRYQLSVLLAAFAMSRVSFDRIVQILPEFEFKPVILDENLTLNPDVLRYLVLLLCPPSIIVLVASDFLNFPSDISDLVTESISTLISSRLIDSLLFPYVNELRSMFDISSLIKAFITEARNRIAFMLTENRFSLPLLLSKCSISRPDASWILEKIQ